VPPLKTVYQSTSTDDFLTPNSHKTELLLSYDFQLRKQGGKSFFCRVQMHFFMKNFFKKVAPNSREDNRKNVLRSFRKMKRSRPTGGIKKRPSSPSRQTPRLSTVFCRGVLFIQKLVKT